MFDNIMSEESRDFAHGTFQLIESKREKMNNILLLVLIMVTMKTYQII